MRTHLAYLKYVLKHKWYVFLECCKLGIPWLGVIHDWSKFRPSEWFPYARYFYNPDGTRRQVRDGDGNFVQDATFDFAWFLHQKRNKHHWQWWILREDNPGERWTIQQMAPDSPMVLALDGVPHLVVEVEDDDAICTMAYRRLCDITGLLNVRGNKVFSMPDRYRREMLADWRGAGRAIAGKDNTASWYESNKGKMQLHPETHQWVEEQLALEVGA